MTEEKKPLPDDQYLAMELVMQDLWEKDKAWLKEQKALEDQEFEETVEGEKP